MSVCAVFFTDNVSTERLESALSQVGLSIDCVIRDPKKEVFLSAASSYDRFFVIGRAPFEFDRLKSDVFIFSDFDEEAERSTVAKLKEEFSLIKERFVFSLIGNIEKELNAFVKSYSGDNGLIAYHIRKKDRRTVVDFLIRKGCPSISIDEALKAFITKFKNEIYADEDVSVEKRFFDMLRLSKRRVRFAESMTGGNICATIVGIPGSSEVVYEGLVTYDTESKYQRLGVLSETVEANTVVSAEVAYEMARSLIDEKASVGIAITGYAPSVFPTENDGLCFIGVAVDDNIRVYRFVFSGDRATVIKKATQAAIFSALRLLSEKG